MCTIHVFKITLWNNQLAIESATNILPIWTHMNKYLITYQTSIIRIILYNKLKKFEHIFYKYKAKYCTAMYHVRYIYSQSIFNLQESATNCSELLKCTWLVSTFCARTRFLLLKIAPTWFNSISAPWTVSQFSLPFYKMGNCQKKWRQQMINVPMTISKHSETNNSKFFTHPQDIKTLWNK